MDESNITTNNQESDGQADESVAVSRLLSQLSDRYVVDRKLGCGGTGVVFLARDAKLGRPVAIKVLHPDVADHIGVDTFQREVRLTAALQHPHILQVLDSGCVDGMCYYITPYLPEGSLQDLMTREGRFSSDKAVRITTDVLEALDLAHAQGIVHCDLKHENILLSNGHAILADFGIARTTVHRGPETDMYVSGSPAYMSPEQASGERQLDGRSDIFGLACVVFEMLAGKAAYTGPNTLAVIAKRFSEPAPDLIAVCPFVPRHVSTAITKALSVDPKDRFPDARAFAAALVSSSPVVPRSWRRGLSGRRTGKSVAKLTRSAIIALLLLLCG